MRRNLSTLPALAKQQAKKEFPPLQRRESSGTQIRLHIDQFMCRQSCRPAEERIQYTHDDAAAHARKTCARDLKIRMQPLRTGNRCSSNGRHQLLQLIFAKTVEKKAGHDEIKRRRWWLPGESIRVNELHLRTCQSCTPQPLLCERDHHRAGLHHRHLRCGKAVPQFHQKAPVAFPIDQHPLRGRNGIQQCRAATLQLPCGAQRLHPAVMRCQQIKAHAGVKAADTVIRKLL